VVCGSADEPKWHRAALCEGGQCLEIGILGEFVMVRKSTDSGGTWVTLSRDEWHAFVVGVKNGEFDEI